MLEIAEIADENWTKIDGYDYEISDKGRVKSPTGIILQHCYDKDGYPRISLWKNGESKTFTIHRLVAKYFVENPCPEKYDQVNHIDEHKDNNFWMNLEWCDNLYNRRYGTGAKRAGESNSIAVIATVIETGEEEFYKSMTEAAEKVGGDNSHICSCVKGERKTAYGRTWRYAAEKQ